MRVKQQRGKTIPLVKVVWSANDEGDTMQELEDKIKESLPHLFQGQLISRTKFLKRWDSCNIPIFLDWKVLCRNSLCLFDMQCGSIIKSGIIHIRDRIIIRQPSDLDFVNVYMILMMSKKNQTRLLQTISIASRLIQDCFNKQSLVSRFI